MEDSFLVSVIIPNFNHSKFLKQRIESVLNQTYQNIELILLDDCSSDNSKEIFSEFKGHPKVSNIVLNEVNSGNTFNQWDLGIGLSRGQIIWIAESDDWCEPNFLESRIIDFDDPDVVLSYCSSMIVWENGKTTIYETENDFYKKIDGEQFINHYMVFGSAIINASSVIFRKSATIDLPDYFRAFKFCGDWIFWVEIASKGKVVKSAKYHNYFRKHKNDVTGKAKSSGLFINEFILVIEYLLNKGFISKEYSYSALLYMLNLILHDKNYSEVQKKQAKKQYLNLIPFEFRLRNKVAKIKNALKKLPIQ